jgi:uncharacterized cupredoxin-like copper-binding protein
MFAAVLFGGCGGSHPSSHDGTVIEIGLKNFAIAAPHTVRAGDVTLRIASTGPTMHELNIAAAAMPADRLPVSADGLVDDQTLRPGFRHLEEREGLDMGDRATMHLHLAPGHYVLYCNMDGHYQAGMATEFTVR